MSWRIRFWNGYYFRCLDDSFDVVCHEGRFIFVQLSRDSFGLFPGVFELGFELTYPFFRSGKILDAPCVASIELEYQKLDYLRS